MSFASLDARIAALSDSIKQTSIQIQHLSKPLHRSHSIESSTPSIVSETSDVSALDANRAELSADVHENLKQQEEDLELLQQDVDDLISPVAVDVRGRGGQGQRRLSQKDREVARLNGACLRLEEDLKMARKRFRNAQLRAKNNAEAAAHKERATYLASLQAAAAASASTSENEKSEEKQEPSRDLLFLGRRGPRKDPNATQDDMMLSATSDVTSSLRRTHALLSSELSRSRFAHETLESSNNALKELNERYTSLDDMLAKSRGLLSTLLKSKKTDEWYLWTAWYVLVATIGWLVFRKLIYGPAWWMIYLPLRIFYKSVFWLLGILFGLANRPTSVSVAEEINSIRLVTRATESPIPVSATMSPSIAISEASQIQSEQRSPPGTLSDEIGQMVETVLTETGSVQAASTEGAGQGQQGQREANPQAEENKPRQQAENRGQEERRRGDGQALPQRDAERDPPNPKKRMMEEPPPVQQQQGGQRKDEL